jgi:uncharacterized protein (TIGR01777 family)
MIGRHLSRALAARGDDVTVLSRSDHADHGRIHYLRWNPDGEGWQEHLSGADAIVNLCGASIGQGRWTASRKRELVDSRVRPSRALVAAINALERPPGALLQASGVNYYGVGEPERVEADAAGDDFLARLAVDWEAPLADTAHRTVAMRFGAVLDAREGALPQMLLPFRLFAGGPVAGGRQWLSWIHIADAVRAIEFLLVSPISGAVNVTAPDPIRNSDFARTAGAVLHRPALLPLPGFVLRSALGEQATLVCDGVRAVPARLEDAGFEWGFPAMRAALEDLVGG